MALDAAANGGSATNKYLPLLLIVGMFVVTYFISIRPQKKKQKEEQQLRENLQIGDEITTIGGIMGRIVTIKEDSIIIETGADRVKMRVMRWAVQTNNTATEKLKAEREAAKAAQDEAKQARIEEAKSRKSKKSEDDQ
ncbi:MAG: preprotein translocase subunit YajC [Clostridia bacterium]|nr:preprotein translocase subunit YajC [Clostridia bacterium]